MSGRSSATPRSGRPTIRTQRTSVSTTARVLSWRTACVSTSRPSAFRWKHRFWSLSHRPKASRVALAGMPGRRGRYTLRHVPPLADRGSPRRAGAHPHAGIPEGQAGPGTGQEEAQRDDQRPSGLARRSGRRSTQREVVMKAAVLRAPGGLDRIEVQDIPDPGQPGPGQIRIALHATSLNYHDLLVANGGIPTADGRVLMSDGAGMVEAVGEGVAEFRPSDHVVSCFFPQWQDGLPWGPVGDFAGTPGDGIDGFAAHFSVRAATALTHAPRGWSHAEAATITTAGVTAWRALVGDGQIKTGDTVLVLA